MNRDRGKLETALRLLEISVEMAARAQDLLREHQDAAEQRVFVAARALSRQREKERYLLRIELIVLDELARRRGLPRDPMVSDYPRLSEDRKLVKLVEEHHQRT